MCHLILPFYSSPQRENVMKLNENNHDILKYGVLHAIDVLLITTDHAQLACRDLACVVCCMAELMAAVLPSRLLVAILQESQNPVVIAVAAHDLGEYVRYYPRGKRWGGEEERVGREEEEEEEEEEEVGEEEEEEGGEKGEEEGWK